MYDLLLKGGEVIDPAQGIHERRDVAVKDGIISAVAKDIDQAEAQRVIPLGGKLVTPGLIDLHCHCSGGLMLMSLPPDQIGLDSGVSLVVDGGSAGAANFHTLRRFIMEPAQTSMFCFLNLATTGLLRVPEIRDELDFELGWAKNVVEGNRDLIKGIKLRIVEAIGQGLGIRAMETAKKLASDLKLPLMVHIGVGRDRVANETMDDFTRAAIKLMEAGDILCHFMTWEAGGLILPDGTIYPELREAQRRGVVLDACHGLSHFNFAIARRAMSEGLLPTVISTDLGGTSVSVVQSLIVTMSKFLNMGLTIDQVVEMTTINPARALGETARWGSLKPGLPANITVLERREGDFLFSDGSGRSSLSGRLLLEPSLVFKAGVPRPCLSRYHLPQVFTTIQRQRKW